MTRRDKMRPYGGMKITANPMTWRGKMLTYDGVLLKLPLHEDDDDDYDFTSGDVMSIGVYIVINTDFLPCNSCSS